MNRKHFENDDFADDKDIISTRELIAEFEAMIDRCSSLLAERLMLGDKFNADFDPSTILNLARDPKIVYTKRSFNQNLPMQVSMVSLLNNLVSGPRNSGRSVRHPNSDRDYVLVGQLSLQKDFPLTHIYEETVGAKIADWFLKGDVDFKECKKFSRRFHVVTQDKERLRTLLSNKPLDDLTAFPHMQLEIHGKTCKFCVSYEVVDEEETKQFIALAVILPKILN